MSTIADITSMVAEGQSQIDELQTKITDLDSEIVKSQSQIDDLASSRSSQVERLEAARIAVKQASKEHTGIVGATKIAGGKSRRGQSKDAPQSAQVVTDAQSALVQVEREIEEAEQATRGLYEELSRLNLEKQRCEGELQLLVQGRDKLHEELGQEVLDSWQETYQVKREELDGLRAQVATVQKELDALYASGMESLSSWPLLLEEAVRVVQPQSDATLRAAEASIAYCSAMLELAPKVSADLLYLPCFVKPFVSGSGFAMDVIVVHEAEVFLARSNKRDLLTRLDWIKRFHREYGEHLSSKDKR